MAGRTITQIAGNYGLTQNANKDIFADSEAATIATVNKTLAQLRSNNDEINAAKGFGRSTFGDAITAQQQNDVLNPVFANFAQARQQEDLNQANFGRQVIAAGVGADITSNAAIQNQALNEKTIGYQTGVQTAAQQTLSAQQGQIQNANTLSQINANQAAQSKINAEQGQIQNTNTLSQINANQAAQSKINAEQGQIQNTNTLSQISANQAAQSKINAEQGQIQNANTLSQINANQAAQSQLNAQQGQIQNINTADQIKASQEAQSQIEAQRGQIQQGNTAAEIAQRTTAASTLESQKAAINQQTVTQQFDYEKQLINQKYDIAIATLQKQSDIAMENLEPELKLKAVYTKQVLQDQINVQRQVSIENMGFSFLTGIASSLLGPTVAAQLADFKLPEVKIPGVN